MKRPAFALAFALVAATAFAQAPPEPKNVQILKGMSNAQLIRTMQFMSASLGVSCDFCHVRTADNHLDAAADTKEEKKTARQMIQLVIDTNTKFFNGNTEVSCETCHRGSTNPVSVPVLPIAMNEPAPANETAAKPAQPARDEVLTRYTKALGNVDAAALTTVELKGTRDTQQGSAPFDVIVAPGRMRSTSTMQNGETVTVVNGTNGWMRDAKGTRTLQPNQIETANGVAEAYRLTLPSDIPGNAFTHRMAVDGKQYDVIIYRPSPATRVRLYFDPATGLLDKRITLTQSPVGMIPQETDFSDYRDVNGVKLPFTVKVQTVDPRAGATRHYSDIKLNAKVDDKDFGEPK